MNRLYVLSGSTSSSDAEALLSSTGIVYETIDASDRETLAAIYRDLSIGVLPALMSESRVFEGLDEIQGFVRGSST